MPYVKVEIAKGIATVDQKRAVIRRMTEVVVEELSRNPEYIFVVIDEIDTGGERASPLPIFGSRLIQRLTSPKPTPGERPTCPPRSHHEE